MMHIEPHPLGGVGVCSPRKCLKFTCSEVTSGVFWGSKKALLNLSSATGEDKAKVLS